MGFEGLRFHPVALGGSIRTEPSNFSYLHNYTQSHLGLSVYKIKITRSDGYPEARDINDLTGGLLVPF